MSRKRKTEETNYEKVQRLTARIKAQLQPNSHALLEELLQAKWEQGQGDAIYDQNMAEYWHGE